MTTERTMDTSTDTSPFAGFEIITVDAMNSSVFSDITLCRPLKVKPTFRKNMLTPSSKSRISRARNQQEAGSNFMILWKFDLDLSSSEKGSG
jgi:hypothetical protein